MKRPLVLTALVPCSLFLAVTASHLAAAAPSFDLDVSDLERKQPAAKPAPPRKKSQHKRPAPQQEEPSSAPVEKTDDVSLYTVRPGDFIFKILMRTYGLTNNQAEALIPEIQKLNKIADIRNLTVGQKIAIPLRKKKVISEEPEARETGSVERLEEPGEKRPIVATSGKKEEAAPAAPTPEPAPRAATKPAPSPEPAPAPKPAPAPQIAAAEPAPAQTPKAFPKPEPTPKRQTADTSIDLSRYPIFPAADGGKILIDMNRSIPEETARRLMQEQPGLRVVSAKSGDVKQLLGKVLREAGFVEVNEDVSLIFGVDPQVSIDADFRVVVKDPKTTKTDAVLIDASRSTSAFSAIEDYLTSQNIRYIDLAPHREKIRVDDQTEVVLLQQGTRCDRLDRLFDPLKIQFERKKKVDLGGFSWTIDRLFSYNGKRYAVACDSVDGLDYMTERLLEMEGYVVIRLVENDPDKAALEILGKLGIQPELRRHVFAVPGRETIRVEISGYLVELNGRRVLLVRSPVEQGVKGLLARMRPIQ